jgi:hypothetical protein
MWNPNGAADASHFLDILRRCPIPPKNRCARRFGKSKKTLFPAGSFHRLVPMAKQVLGRDLGALLGRKPKESAPAPPSAPEPSPAGAGVRSLLRGHRPPASEPAQKGTIPRWYLFAGDVLLVALALITIYKSPRPVSWKTELFCGATVLLAAALAVIAVSTRESKDPDSRARTGPFK